MTELETKAPQFVVAAGLFVSMVAIGYILGLAVSRVIGRAGHTGRWERLSGRVAAVVLGFAFRFIPSAWMELEAHLWVDIRDPERSEGSLSTVRTRAMVAARAALLDAGYTPSSDTTTALAAPPLTVRLDGARDPSP